MQCRGGQNFSEWTSRGCIFPERWRRRGIKIWEFHLPLVALTNLCPGKDYWADFYNFLHMNPSYDQMKKYLSREKMHKNVLVDINGLNQNSIFLNQNKI